MKFNALKEFSLKKEHAVPTSIPSRTLLLWRVCFWYEETTTFDYGRNIWASSCIIWQCCWYAQKKLLKYYVSSCDSKCPNDATCAIIQLHLFLPLKLIRVHAFDSDQHAQIPIVIFFSAFFGIGVIFWKLFFCYRPVENFRANEYREVALMGDLNVP